LEAIRAFVHVATPSSSIAKEFARYRCIVERGEVKKAVEKMGQTNLKKWLSKAQ
jgi:origin recognition complex subunit 4